MYYFRKKYPSHWPVVGTSAFKRIAARNANQIISLFNRTMSVKNVTILSVEEVCNEEHYDKYQLYVFVEI